MDLYENFRTNIQLLRIEKRLSSKELSKALEFNERRISNLEQSHKPTVEELVAIAEFFKVSSDSLIHKKAMVTFN